MSDSTNTIQAEAAADAVKTADAVKEADAVKTETLHRHDLPTGVLGICHDADSNRIFAACVDGVYSLDPEHGQPELLYAHESYASGVVRDPVRPVIVSAGYDGQLIWYDLEHRSVFRRVKAHNFWSWRIAISPDGKLLASVTGQYLAGGETYEPAAEREPSVKVYDVATGRLRHAFPHVPSVQSVAFSPCSGYVAAGNLMGEVRVWDIAREKMVANWTTDAFTCWGIIKSHCYIGGIYSLSFTPDGDHLLAAGMGPMRDPMAGNGRQLWQRFAWREPNTPMIDQTHEGESGEGLMETLALHPTRPVFLMGGRLRGGEWNAALFSSASGDRKHHMNTGFRMTAAQFTRDGQQLVMAGSKGQGAPKDGEFSRWGRIEIHRILEA
jgi:WD40 repeat protein